MNVRKWVSLAMLLAALLSVWPVGTIRAEDPPPAGFNSQTPPPVAAGSITLYKFNDLNANGMWDGGELAIEGWAMRLYRWADDGLQLVGEIGTGPDGSATFTNLASGRYKVWEEARECWTPTTPAGLTAWEGGYYTVVELGDKDQLTVVFGNHDTCEPPPPPEPGSITVHKFNDLNADGVQDPNEPPIEGWRMRIYRWADDGLQLVAEAPTGADGSVTFTGLEPGRYKVWEEVRECWEPTLPLTGTYWEGGYYVVVYLDPGQQLSVVFGNTYICTTPPPQPCIDLEKSGPETLEGPGGQITYHFWVRNCGNVALTEALVYDPHFGETPLWSGALQPGEVYEFDQVYTLPADFCGEFPNQAWAIGRLTGYAEVRDDDTWNVTVNCKPTPQPCIDLEKSGPETLDGPGGQITYHFWVRNCGNVALTEALVYDPHFGETPLWSGSLQPGEVYEFDQVYTLPADFCGEFPNQAWAIGRLTGYAEVRDDDTWNVTVRCQPAPQPAIAVEKYVSVDNGVTWLEADTPTGPEVQAGSQTVRFRFVVTNSGDVALSNVTLQDSDFDLSGCAVVSPLAPTASFECVIGPLAAVLGQHADTATAAGEYEGRSYTAQDDAYYLGTPQPPVPTTLTLLPDSATNVLPADLSHEFVATVLDQNGNPLSGIWVSFSTNFGYFISLGGPTYLMVQTDANGQAAVMIYSNVPGTATIRAWVDDGDGIYTVGELTDEPSIKEWVGEGPTNLVVTKTSTPSLSRVYAWNLTNVADPLVLELPRGYSRPVTYTITAARSVVNDVYALAGTISAQNTGVNAAHIVQVVDALEYRLDGVWTELSRVTVSGETWVSVGATGNWPYNFNFTPVAGATAYRNVAYVTLANYADGQHLFTYTQSFELPTAPTAETDECARVVDTAAVPAGFSATSDYPTDGWSPCASAVYLVHMTVTNNTVTSGVYTLGNTAVLTATDSNTQLSAQATVQLNVPNLVVSKSAQVTWSRSYDWAISKSADPAEVDVYRTNNPGVSRYTIIVTRTATTDSYAVAGVITATNNSGVTVTVTSVLDCIEYSGSNLACQTLTPGGVLAPNATRTWNYNIAFTPLAGVTQYQNRAEVAIALSGGGTQTFFSYRQFTLPGAPNNEVDECATINDALTSIPEGFTADWVWEDDGTQNPWQTCASETRWASVWFLNEDVDNLTYYLTNTVTLTEQDSLRTVAANAVIRIIGHAIVPSRVLIPAVGPVANPDLVTVAADPIQMAPVVWAQQVPAVKAVAEPAASQGEAPAPGLNLLTYHAPDGGVAVSGEAAAVPEAVTGESLPEIKQAPAAVRPVAPAVEAAPAVAAAVTPAEQPVPVPPVAPVAATGTVATLGLAGLIWLVRRRKP